MSYSRGGGGCCPVDVDTSAQLARVCFWRVTLTNVLVFDELLIASEQVGDNVETRRLYIADIVSRVL